MATESDSVQWDVPRSLAVILKYPKDGGLGNVITYVEIITEQVKYFRYHLRPNDLLDNDKSIRSL